MTGNFTLIFFINVMKKPEKHFVYNVKGNLNMR